MAWNTTGCSVKTSKQSGSTILFALAGQQTVYQWDVAETTEVRGLNETAGLGDVPDTAAEAANVDNTTQTQYWRHVSGRTYSINVITGSKTEYGSARKDESGQWVCTRTTHTYFATGMGTGVWGTAELDADGNTIALSSNGVTRVVSRDKSSSYVCTFYGHPLSSVVTTTVSEIRYVSSQAAAEAIVDANTSSAAQTTVHTPYTAPDPRYPESSGYTIAVSWAQMQIPLGDEKFASARFVSNTEGWTVTVTHKNYSKEGSGWTAD